MGDSVVDAQLYHLGVYHNQLHIGRIRLVNNTHDQCIDTDGLTGAGSACNQKMRHLCNIRNNHLTADILSHRKSQTGFVAAEGFGFKKFTQINNVVFLIRHLNPHCGFSGNRSLDPDICRCKTQLDIISQRNDLADLYALFRKEFITGNRRTAADIRHSNAYTEIMKGLLKLDRCGLKFIFRKSGIMHRLFQQIRRREYIFLFFLYLFMDLLSHRNLCCLNLCRLPFLFQFFLKKIRFRFDDFSGGSNNTFCAFRLIQSIGSSHHGRLYRFECLWRRSGDAVWIRIPGRCSVTARLL